MDKLCKVCGKLLSSSQYSLDKKYKSCPRCSQENGDEHVYYEYPECFGTTLKRSSSNSPEGAQSYCESCRFDKEYNEEKLLCSEIKGI